MSDDKKGKTYNFDVCSQCKTICCQGANPPLTQKRKRIIVNYLEEQNLPAKDVFVQAEYCHPAVDVQDYCIFYNKETGKCRVHAVKPETCKAGPITFDINLKTLKVEWFLKKAEICQLAPQLHLNQSQFNEHFEVAKEEITRLICNLEAEALQAILTISEPETFKIGEDELPKTVKQKLRIA
jgi:hypothetical protein